MRRPTGPLLVLGMFMAGSCLGVQKPVAAPTVTSEILLTSEQGAKQSSMENVAFRKGIAAGAVISVFPDSTKQTIHGIGTSFTESSAFVLAHLDPEQRREVMGIPRGVMQHRRGQWPGRPVRSLKSFVQFDREVFFQEGSQADAGFVQKLGGNACVE